jgi:D-sedoheptulose 7-phosphate isomerase
MTESEVIASNYREQLLLAISVFPMDDVIRVANLLKANLGSGTLYTAGNGGSASTASHMATDLGVGSLRRRNPLRVMSLVDNAAVLTATANDLNFDQIFAQQLRLLAKKGDFFICFSASGNSQNLINAVEEAKKQGTITISITGFDGGTLRTLADHNIHIESEIGSYGVVEDVHSTVSHLITEIIRDSE